MGEHRDDHGRTVLHIDEPANRRASGCPVLAADAGAWLQVTYDRHGTLPDVRGATQPPKRGRLVVDDQHRPDPEEPDFSDPVAIGAITDPTDLRTLGSAIGRYLNQWDDDELAICFDSMTALLDHVDEEAAFKFMHLFIQRLEEAEAVAHFHLNAGEHDEATIKTFTELVDAVERPQEPDPHAGIDSGATEETTQEDVHEHLQQVADGGVPEDTESATGRPAPANIDEATDQEIADRFAGL